MGEGRNAWEEAPRMKQVRHYRILVQIVNMLTPTDS